jgi:hypothetical protein
MITFELSENDYLEALRLHSSHSKQWWWMSLGSAAMLGCAAFLAFGPYASPMAISWTLYLVAAMAWLWMVTLAARFFIMPRRLHRMFSQSKMLRTPRSYMWTDEALITQTSYGTNTIPWSDFLKSDADDKVTLLYTTPRQFLCVPRRAFADPGDAEAFGRLIKEKIGQG